MGNTCCDDRNASSSQHYSRKAQRPSGKGTEQGSSTQLSVPKAEVRTLEAVRALQGEFQDHFQVMGPISSSPNSCLKQGLDKATGLPCSIREIPKNLSAKPSKKLGKDALIWQKLDHPNILRLIDVVQDFKSVYLISENCVGQDFQRYLQARRIFSEPEAAGIMLQIFGVISAGHKQGVIYRNLHPGSFILLSMPSNTAPRHGYW